MKFPEFNQVVNPNDEPCYVAMRHGQAPQAMKYTGIIRLAKTDHTLEIGWKIPKGFYVIQTTALQIIPILQARNEKLLAIQSDNNTLSIIVKGSFKRKTTNNILACGINADTLVHSKAGDVFKLPFKMKGNSSQELSKMSVVHSNGIDEVPHWLRPLRKISGEIADGFALPILNNNQSLILNTLRRIKHFKPEEQRDIAKIVNEEFSTQPLADTEMAKLMNISEEQITKDFFDKEKFLHHKMGDYLVKTCNIKRDKASRELFYFDDRKKIYVNDQDYIMGYMTKLVPSLKNYQKEEVLKYLNAYLYDESVEFNAEAFTVVFNNGVLDLSTMRLEPCTPDHIESIKIRSNYNPNARSKIVDEFFQTATDGDKDIETLLYESIGYSMLKTNELQKAFILVGKGRNGKSTYLDLIKAVLGKEHTTNISFKDLSNNFRASNLSGKLASLAGDISNQPIQDSDLLKSITAGEDVLLEEKYKQAYSQSLFSTLFFAANKLPRTPDTSDGFYRRWTIVPFIADLSAVSRVKGMQFKKKLLAQDAIDYVATKAIHAIYNVLETTEEFTEPKAVKEMMRHYQIDNSTVLSWYDETFKKREELEQMTSRSAYISYSNWCATSGRNKFSVTNFVKTVEIDIGVVFKDTK